MEKSKSEEERGKEERTRMNEEQRKKLLSVFFLLKKLRISFKTEMFLALIKTPASKPDLDKWAFIFRSTQKLPFGLEELHTIVDMAKDQLGDLPLTVDAKEIMYDQKKCFAITFEVKLK